MRNCEEMLFFPLREGPSFMLETAVPFLLIWNRRMGILLLLKDISCNRFCESFLKISHVTGFVRDFLLLESTCHSRQY